MLPRGFGIVQVKLETKSKSVAQYWTLNGAPAGIEELLTAGAPGTAVLIDDVVLSPTTDTTATLDDWLVARIYFEKGVEAAYLSV
jgi:hypothetical protein